MDGGGGGGGGTGRGEDHECSWTYSSGSLPILTLQVARLGLPSVVGQSSPQGRHVREVDHRPVPSREDDGAVIPPPSRSRGGGGVSGTGTGGGRRGGGGGGMEGGQPLVEGVTTASPTRRHPFLDTATPSTRTPL